MPKIIIYSLGTLRRHIAGGKYKSVLSYEKFLKKYQIGIKVVDETHLAFNTVVAIDLASNVERNIYLTATFAVSNKRVREIFNIIFPDEMKYIDAGENYTNCIFYNYNSGVPAKVCRSSKGYNHFKFEKYMLKKKTYLIEFFNNLKALTDDHYIPIRKEGDKLLIYFGTVKFIDNILGYFKQAYKDLNVVRYTSDDPDSNLVDGDIILTTHGSCGTGTDVKGARVSINTVSFRTDVKANQLFGRLRERKDADTLFIDMYDGNIDSHVSHYQDRAIVYRTRSVNYKEERLYS
jgi:hypothetical protein